jgi:pantetheine-phosphate adenylyltransferase
MTNNKKFRLVAMGGTFDEIHIGHLSLFSKAFEVSDKVIIGVTSDEFASKARGKNNLNHNYNQRVANVKKIIEKRFGFNNYRIIKLDDEYGPTPLSADVDALVASSETANKGVEINKMRWKNGLTPLKIILVDMMKAEDGNPISSSRIRSGEIDASGKLLKIK